MDREAMYCIKFKLITFNIDNRDDRWELVKSYQNRMTNKNITNSSKDTGIFCTIFT